jgi:carboxypeptidase Q
VRRLAIRLFLTTAFAASLVTAVAAPAAAQGLEPATLARIREAAMSDDWAWQQLETLTDTIGPRLSGSPGHAAAVSQVAAAMRALGAQVTLQPVKVPHWVRGEETGQVVEYPGRPAGLTQRLQLTALGGSGATSASGLTARVVVVSSFEELKTHAAEVRGNFVLFNGRFDRHLADNGRAYDAYSQTTLLRSRGPAEAAALGATAALVRSVGSADYRLPHTGATRFPDGMQPIPAAALSAEDADLVARLAAKGAVTLKVTLTPQTLPDADSFNVIADWQGREKPDEYVVVSGHLDSWDLGTGAIDDGSGVFATAAVIRVLKTLNLKPRRTIRFIAWANEENGTRGAREYRRSVEQTLDKHAAVIESDAGIGRTLGINATVQYESLAVLRPVSEALRPIGATSMQRRDSELGSDISFLQAAGIPGFSPISDLRDYFDYHHTAADTLDKVDPQNLKMQAATNAVLAYFLAEMPEMLPRHASR